jgi:multidrug efflux pump subunit AcrB
LSQHEVHVERCNGELWFRWVESPAIAARTRLTPTCERGRPLKAAAFSYSATAMPRLTGALTTVAAVMPIGFSKSTTGEYAGGIFWIVGATAAAFALAVWVAPFVPQQFFPNSDRPELVVERRLKEGASFAATTEQVKRMEAVLKNDEDVRFFF